MTFPHPSFRVYIHKGTQNKDRENELNIYLHLISVMDLLKEQQDSVVTQFYYRNYEWK